VFLLLPAAKADSLNINNFPVFYINGNPVWIPIQATSETVGSEYLPSAGTDVYVITYPFADGNGSVVMDLTHGVFGNIQFTVPVTSVTFDWTTDSVFTAMFVGPGGQEATFQSNQTIGSDTFSAPEIDAINWVTGTGTTSFGGIISITDTVGSGTPVPEPSTTLLLSLGLVGLLLLRMGVFVSRGLPRHQT
jgi:hypothetical protein